MISVETVSQFAKETLFNYLNEESKETEGGFDVEILKKYGWSIDKMFEQFAADFIHLLYNDPYVISAMTQFQFGDQPDFIRFALEEELMRIYVMAFKQTRLPYTTHGREEFPALLTKLVI